MKSLIALLFLILISLTLAQGRTFLVNNLPESDEHLMVLPAEPVSYMQTGRLSNWSVETSLTFPLARIYMLKASYRIAENAELGFGPAFQNWKNTEQTPRGQSHAYTMVISYRHYFWRNFNAEIEFWPALNHFDSYVDRKTYKGLELWVEYKLGYKAHLTQNLFVNLQPGIGHALWMQHKWPDVETRALPGLIKSSLFFVPQVVLGWSF
jgi:hypothetical protein